MPETLSRPWDEGPRRPSQLTLPSCPRGVSGYSVQASVFHSQDFLELGSLRPEESKFAFIPRPAFTNFVEKNSGQTKIIYFYKSKLMLRSVTLTMFENFKNSLGKSRHFLHQVGTLLSVVFVRMTAASTL